VNEITVKEAFENHRYILDLKSRIGGDLLRLASLLIISHDNQYYRTLGYDTWEEYLGTPEISMSRFFAFKLMKVYEIWVNKFNVSPAKLDIDIEKLYLTSIIATNENYEEILEQARNLSRSDVKQLKSGDYEFDSQRYKMVICPFCNHEIKVML